MSGQNQYQVAMLAEVLQVKLGGVANIIRVLLAKLRQSESSSHHKPWNMCVCVCVDPVKHPRSLAWLSAYPSTSLAGDETHMGPPPNSELRWKPRFQ